MNTRPTSPPAGDGDGGVRHADPDDLEIFAPWDCDPLLEGGRMPEEAPARTAARRQPGAPSPGRSWRPHHPPFRPTPPRRPPDPVTSPGAYLRAVGLPLVMDVAQRLEQVGHHTSVQDLLDLPEPSLRLMVWPRPDPLRPWLGRVGATFEIAVGDDDPDEVEARFWFTDRPETVYGQELAGRAEVEPAWLQRQVLRFVETLLREA